MVVGRQDKFGLVFLSSCLLVTICLDLSSRRFVLCGPSQAAVRCIRSY